MNTAAVNYVSICRLNVTTTPLINNMRNRGIQQEYWLYTKFLIFIQISISNNFTKYCLPLLYSDIIMIGISCNIYLLTCLKYSVGAYGTADS